jgi:methyltransferase (TIGR00027 family)
VIEARPSRTALRVAQRRAAHQLLDQPLVLEDPVAIPILGSEAAARLRADPGELDKTPFDKHLRAFLVVRSRFAEDYLDAARNAGVNQYVVLGAGLDTYAYRQRRADPQLRVWEIDHPATQAWKRELLAAAGILVPSNLVYVAVDFERESLADALPRAGFDARSGAVFAWLGVTPYLTRDAIDATLRCIASVAGNAGGVAFDYALSRSSLTVVQQAVFDAFSARVAAAGEPLRTTFEPDGLAADLRALGFARVEDASPAALNARYLLNRTDGLRVGGMAHMMWASGNG